MLVQTATPSSPLMTGEAEIPEFNPLLSAEARFDEAANQLNLDDGMRKVLTLAGA